MADSSSQQAARPPFEDPSRLTKLELSKRAAETVAHAGALAKAVVRCRQGGQIRPPPPKREHAPRWCAALQSPRARLPARARTQGRQFVAATCRACRLCRLREDRQQHPRYAAEAPRRHCVDGRGVGGRLRRGNRRVILGLHVGRSPSGSSRFSPPARRCSTKR